MPTVFTLSGQVWSATVDIQTETRDNVISVPIQSVTTRLVKEKMEGKSEANMTEAEKKETEEKEEVVFLVKEGGKVKKTKVENRHTG